MVHDLRPVILVNGKLLVILAAIMLVPALVDLANAVADWQAFATAAVITAFVGSCMVAGTTSRAPFSLSTWQSFMLTTSSWVIMAGFGALPFCFSVVGLSYTDAYFETMSGLTTTGSTVIVGLDTLPHGLLLWRSLLHWLGGIGIIVVAVTILPALKIGGMQLFRMESSDKAEKIKPRVTQITRSIAMLYLVFTLITAAALWLAGMSIFEAICHAMSALSTGGFSTSDASVGHFASPAIEWILTLGMLVGGMTFTLFVLPWKNNPWAVVRNSQIRAYVGFLLFCGILLGVWRWSNADGVLLGDSIRAALFNVISVVTTTGFASEDYTLWGTFAQVMFFFLTFVGGCSGSTAGGIKIFRFQVLFRVAGSHLRKLIYPNGIFAVDYNRHNISDDVVRSVTGFMILYLITFAVLAMVLSVCGMDLTASLSGSITAVSNVGPGLGPIIGPAGNFSTVPDTAKWALSIGMMLGRLELMTVFIIFTRSFWRA